MGQTWIVVVTYADGTTNVERFTDEDAARALYGKLLVENYRDVYLATARSEAHR